MSFFGGGVKHQIQHGCRNWIGLASNCARASGRVSERNADQKRGARNLTLLDNADQPSPATADARLIPDQLLHGPVAVS